MTEEKKLPTIKTGGQTSNEKLIEIKEALELAQFAYINLSKPINEAEQQALENNRSPLTTEEKQEIVYDTLKNQPGWGDKKAADFTQRYEVVSAVDYRLFGIRISLIKDKETGNFSIPAAGTHIPKTPATASELLNIKEDLIDFGVDVHVNQAIFVLGKHPAVEKKIKEIITEWVNENLISENDNVTFIGHSQPQAHIPYIKSAHKNIIDHAYAFSGPGTGGIIAEAMGPKYEYTEGITLVFAKEGLNIINGFGTMYADEIIIFDHPDSGKLYTHGTTEIGEALNHEMDQRSFDTKCVMIEEKTVAEIAKTYGLSPEDLCKANPGLEKGQKVSKGQILILPLSIHEKAKRLAGDNKILGSKLAKQFRTLESTKKHISVMQKLIQKIKDNSNLPAEEKKQMIDKLEAEIMRTGRQYSATCRKITELLKNNPQQKLHKPSPQKNLTNQEQPIAQDEKITIKKTESLQYTVQKDDNLTKIAKKHNTTVKAIVDLNQLDNPNLIKTDQIIKIPKANSLTISKSILVKTEITNDRGEKDYVFKGKSWNKEIQHHKARDVAKVLTFSGVGHDGHFIEERTINISHIRDSIINHYGSVEKAIEAVEGAQEQMEGYGYHDWKEYDHFDHVFDYLLDSLYSKLKKIDKETSFYESPCYPHITFPASKLLPPQNQIKLSSENLLNAPYNKSLFLT